VTAYYNEIDPYAAQWLRNLIKAGHIADGEVDTRSIIDVRPDDLREFTQCHFFAGIGGWSHALHLAEWPDDKPIWTGSCPCQPFSVAGKGKGTDDERHLWPHFFRLIRGCRPPVVMGEQVAGAAGYGWLDGVRFDLESEGYAIEGVDIPACSANAPHIRSRLYWVANTNSGGCESAGKRRSLAAIQERELYDRMPITERDTCGNNLANANKFGASEKWEQRSREQLRVGENEGNSNDLNMVDADLSGSSRQCERRWQPEHQKEAEGPGELCVGRPGFWDNAVLLNGADGKTRRAKSGVRLLANGIPARVGKLRAYGNAIVPPLAAEVIKAFMETQYG